MDGDLSYWSEPYANFYNSMVDNDPSRYPVDSGDVQRDCERHYSTSTNTTANVVGFVSSMPNNFPRGLAPSRDMSLSHSSPFLPLGNSSARQPQLYINTQIGPIQPTDKEYSTASSNSLLNALQTPYTQSQSSFQPTIFIASPWSAPADGRLSIPDLGNKTHLSPVSPLWNSAPRSEGDVSPISPIPMDPDVVTQLPMPQIVEWKRVVELCGTNDFVPQVVYQPHTEADRKRYIRDVQLRDTIFFQSDDSPELGISLDDARMQRHKNLKNKDDLMFVGCGPSVSIRIHWPGYASWSKQIPTMDFRNPKGPITRTKLAKNIATCFGRFAEEVQDKPMEADSDPRWKIGKRHIKVEDLILVSLHHVSKGSWQPQLRFRTPSPTLPHPWNAPLHHFVPHDNHGRCPQH